MKYGDKFFVYGTLRQGAPCHNIIAGRAEFVGKDHIWGRMYDLGRFPGIVIPPTPEGGYRIKGDVFQCMDSALASVLDRYEGVPQLYLRAQTITERGHPVWTYVFNRPTEGQLIVKSGDWLQHHEAQHA